MSETQDAGTGGISTPVGSQSKSWLGRDNVISNNGSYTGCNWNTLYTDYSDYLDVPIDNFTITSATSITVHVRHLISVVNPNIVATVYVSQGGSFCAGHTITDPSTSEADRSTTCSHFGTWNGTELDAMRVRVRYTNMTINALIQIDHIYATANVPVNTIPDVAIAPTIVSTCLNVTVTSTEPDDGGSPLTGWRIQYDDNSGFTSPGYKPSSTTWYTPDKDGSSNETFVNPVSAGSTMYAKVLYKNLIGDASSYSPYGSIATDDVPATPAWATTKFTARTINSITFDWVATTDWGGCASSTEYHYQWKISGGTYATVDTNDSTNTIATKSSLSAGTLYYFKVAASTLVGVGVYNTEASHWTLCATPSAPTVIPNATGGFNISHSAHTGVLKWRIMHSDTFDGVYTEVVGSPFTVSLGSALSEDLTGYGADKTKYFKLYAQNSDGNDSTLGTYGSSTTWDVPETSADPTLDQDTVDEIEVTKPTNPASDDSITHWYVEWDTNASFTSPDFSGDIPIGTTVYDASYPTVLHGYTFYVRVRFKSASGYGEFSVGAVNITVYDVPSPSSAPVVTPTATGILTITRPSDPSSDMPITDWYIYSSYDGYASPMYFPVYPGDLSYDSGNLGANQTRQYKVSWGSDVGEGDLSPASLEATTWDVPETSDDPTLDPNAVGQIEVTKPNNPSSDDALTHWQVQWDDFDGFLSPDSSGDILIGTTTYDATSIPDGALRYFRVRFKSDSGYGEWSVGTVNATTWDNPDAQDLVSVTNPYPQALRITRETTYPDGNGDPVDTWGVWRATSELGTYYLVQDGLTDITYDDKYLPFTQDYWYKAVFYNEVGGSLRSDTALWGRADPNRMNIPSSLRIKATSQLYSPSSLVIKLTSQLYKPSSLLVNLIINLYKPSSLRIRLIDQQLSLPSSLVIGLTSQLSLPSSLLVNLIVNLSLPSSLIIRLVNQQLSLPSNLVVSLTTQLVLPSALRVLEYRATFTPTVTFSRYELNDATEPTIDEEIDLGLWEGHKTITAIAVDPYEDTMVNPDKHEFYYAVDPEGGNENFFQVPLTNGLMSVVSETPVFEDGYRGLGYDQQSWGVGVTEIIALIDVNGDWAGSGSRVNLTGAWSNAGTAWSPPSASGTNVLDVPTVYHGCCMTVVQPTDWDSNPDHKLHDWLPLQVSVGHAVEVKDFSMISGTHEDSTIDLQGNLNTAYDISFRVYHERPKEWEWYSGATKIDSGTLTTDKDTWQMLNNLDMGTTHLSGTTTFSLKLYANSGSILHPNPVRVMTVNRII